MAEYETRKGRKQSGDKNLSRSIRFDIALHCGNSVSLVVRPEET